MRRMRLVLISLLGAGVLALAGTASAAASYGVMVWGGGELFKVGTLGNGTTSGSDVPLTVNGLSEVSSITSGFGQIIAVMNDGTVKSWGLNKLGELGVGSGAGQCDPEIECGLKPESVPGLTGVTSASAGLYHTLALLSNGTVKAWGDDAQGQLGPETVSETCLFTSEMVPCSRTPVAVSGLTEVKAIAAGGGQSLALLNDGKVMAWGENVKGQLGDGTTTDSATPVEVTGLPDEPGLKVIAISAGYAESMALLSNGTVMAWGGNGHGQLGQEEHPPTGPETCGPEKEPCSTKPLLVKGLSDVSAISAGYWNEVALRSNHTVMTWGNDERGQLGIGDTTGPELCPFPDMSCSSTPVEVPGLSGVTQVVASKDTEVLALLENGSVMAWGAGGGGQLGNGAHAGHPQCAEFYCSPSPTPVSGIAHATMLAAGAESGVALVPTGSPPEFGRCLPAKADDDYEGGKYEGGCAAEGASRDHEWYAGVHAPGFTVSGKDVKLVSIAGKEIICQSESATSEFSDTKQVRDLVMRLTGCQLIVAGLDAECTSAGAQEGEVVTYSLEGTLGWEDKATAKVALALTPTAGSERVAEFLCTNATTTLPVLISGSVIAQIAVGHVNKMASALTLKFKQTKGKQAPEQVEGGSKDTLELAVGSEAAEQAGLALQSKQATEERIEVNTSH
jgi:alpha-tubulin suppressor-like RCC1 family protein